MYQYIYAYRLCVQAFQQLLLVLAGYSLAGTVYDFFIAVSDRGANKIRQRRLFLSRAQNSQESRDSLTETGQRTAKGAIL